MPSKMASANRRNIETRKLANRKIRKGGIVEIPSEEKLERCRTAFARVNPLNSPAIARNISPKNEQLLEAFRHLNGKARKTPTTTEEDRRWIEATERVVEETYNLTAKYLGKYRLVAAIPAQREKDKRLRKALISLFLLTRGEIREVARLTDLNQNVVGITCERLGIKLYRLKEFISKEETRDAIRKSIPEVDFKRKDRRKQIYESVGKALEIRGGSAQQRISALGLADEFEESLNSWERNRLIVAHARTRGQRTATYRTVYGSKGSSIGRKIEEDPRLKQAALFLEGKFKEEDRIKADTLDAQAKRVGIATRAKRERLVEQLAQIDARLDKELKEAPLPIPFRSKKAISIDEAIDRYLEKELKYDPTLPEIFKIYKAFLSKMKRKIIKCVILKKRNEAEMSRLLGLNREHYRQLLFDLGISIRVLNTFHFKVHTLEAYSQAFDSIKNWDNSRAIGLWKGQAARILGIHPDTITIRLRDIGFENELEPLKHQLMLASYFQRNPKPRRA